MVTSMNRRFTEDVFYGGRMTQEAPAGYITMYAADIQKAVEKAIKAREAERAAWLIVLREKIVQWRNRRGWIARFDMWGMPRDPDKLVEWFLDKHAWDRPDIPGVDSEPTVTGFHRDWSKRVKNLAAEDKVFVAIDDAAVHLSWIKAP